MTIKRERPPGGGGRLDSRYLGSGKSGNYSTTHLPKYWLEIGRAIEQAGRASKALREG
jgi:hypothetical protein